MGLWGVDPFDNDTACDWASDLHRADGLKTVCAAIDAVLASAGPELDSTLAWEALAACEVIARLKGNWGEQNAYTRDTDDWVKAHPITPGEDLIERANAAIDRVVAEDSELYDNWEGDEDWLDSVASLRRRVSAAPGTYPSTYVPLDLTIESSPRHALRTAAAIGLGVFLCVGIYMLAMSVGFGRTPVARDWALVGGMAVAGVLLWLAYGRLTRDHHARVIHLDDDTLRIERPDGRAVTLDWRQLQAIDYYSEDDSVLTLTAGQDAVTVYSYGFAGSDWSRFHRSVFACRRMHTELRDRSKDIAAKTNTWLDRGALACIVVGVVATITLAAWDVSNAAWGLSFIGTLPVLIVIGSRAEYDHEPRLPFAKTAGFFAAKLLAVLPIGLIVYVFVSRDENLPNARWPWLYLPSNVLFFGGMAGALLVHGGWSPTQHYKGRPRGVNRYAKAMFYGSLVACAVGFALKYLNESGG